MARRRAPKKPWPPQRRRCQPHATPLTPLGVRAAGCAPRWGPAASPLPLRIIPPSPLTPMTSTASYRRFMLGRSIGYLGACSRQACVRACVRMCVCACVCVCQFVCFIVGGGANGPSRGALTSNGRRQHQGPGNPAVPARSPHLVKVPADLVGVDGRHVDPAVPALRWWWWWW